MLDENSRLRIIKAYFEREDGTQIHYRSSGSSGPVLLLIHFNAGSSAMFEPVMIRFAELGYRAVAIDLPGCGMSDATPNPPQIEDYGEAARALVKSIAGEDPYAVLGHHTGASVSLYLASTYKEEVIAGIGSALSRLPAEFAAGLANHEWPEWDAEGAQLARWWQRTWNVEWNIVHLGTTTDIAADVTARTCAEMMLAHPRQPFGHRAVGRCDHDQLLHDLKVPYLCTSGRFDPMYAYSIESAALSPYACTADLGDGSVFIADRDPEGFVNVVHTFLSKTAHEIREIMGD